MENSRHILKLKDKRNHPVADFSNVVLWAQVEILCLLYLLILTFYQTFITHCFLPSDNIEYAETFFENMRANESEKFNSVNSRAAVNGSMVDYKTIPWDWLDLHECDQ